jgi:GT2 family glycosyltransferase
MFQADALISNKDILILLESHKKYKDCFVTSPTYYDKESKLSYSSGFLPEKNNTKDILNLEGDVCVEAVLGSIILFKKKDIIELGLFDENFFLYYLDFELCRRIKNIKNQLSKFLMPKFSMIHGQIKVKNILKKTFIRNYILPSTNSIIFLK